MGSIRTLALYDVSRGAQAQQLEHLLGSAKKLEKAKKLIGLVVALAIIPFVVVTVLVFAGIAAVF